MYIIVSGAHGMTNTDEKEKLIAEMRAALSDPKNGASRWNTALSKWQATQPENSYIPIHGIALKDRDLSGFRFTQVKFENCRFESCSLTGNVISRCQFLNSSFRNTTFSDVTFSTVFAKHLTLEGMFEQTSIHESILSDCCIEGKFTEKNGRQNRISHNPVISCTEIVVKAEPGNKATALDLSKGPLIFEKNSPSTASGRGVYNTNLYVLDGTDAAKLHRQNIAHPQLGNHIIGASCIAELGKPEALTDYSAETTSKEKNLEKRFDRAERSVANLKTGLYVHEFGVGDKSWNFSSSGLPYNLKAINEMNPHLLSLAVSGFGGDMANGKMQFITAGPRYSWTAGGEPGFPTINYRASMGIGGGKISLLDTHRLTGNDKRTINGQFVMLMPGFNVATWRGNLGLDVGGQWPITINTSQKTIEGLYKNADNSPTGDTYSITANKAQIGPSANATVKYNLMPRINGRDSKGHLCVFVRTDFLPATQITYEANTPVNDPAHGIRTTDPKLRYTTGFSIGF